MLPIISKKGKGKKSVFIWCSFFVVPHTQGAQAWIIQFHLQLHQCLPLPRTRSPDGASQNEVVDI